jgi:hypothetical protein
VDAGVGGMSVINRGVAGQNQLMKQLVRFLSQHWLASILVVGFILLAVFAVRNALVSPEDPRLAAIRQAGYPVTPAELNAFYPAVPENQNAALVYGRAFESALFTNKIAEVLISNVVSKRGERLTEAYRAELAEALGQNAAAWELLYSATNFSGSRYPIDLSGGFAVLLPHVSKVKQAAALLSIEGLSRASVGESNQAYAAVDAALHVSDSLRQEPLLISYLVRVAADKIVAQRLEETLNLVGFSDDELRRLQTEFAAANDQRWPARALAAERAVGLSVFLDRQVQRSLTGPNQLISGMPLGFPGRLFLGAYLASGFMARDRTFYLEDMGKSVAFAELPPEERIRKGPLPKTGPIPRSLILSRMLLPSLSQVIVRADDYSARMRVVQAALTVERFRLAHSGALPTQLTEVVPEVVEAVPIDPYDAQPLRYRKLPLGYVVYSIGPDLHDDGGAAPPSDQRQARSTPTPADITFTVERN